MHYPNRTNLLVNKLHSLKMEETSYVIDFIRSVKELMTQLASVRELLPYARVVHIMLNLFT
jgi:hypothetical protein